MSDDILFGYRQTLVGDTPNPGLSAYASSRTRLTAWLYRSLQSLIPAHLRRKYRGISRLLQEYQRADHIKKEPAGVESKPAQYLQVQYALSVKCTRLFPSQTESLTGYKYRSLNDLSYPYLSPSGWFLYCKESCPIPYFFQHIHEPGVLFPDGDLKMRYTTTGQQKADNIFKSS